MPRYEFMCDTCKKPFELTMAHVGTGQGQDQLPHLQGQEGHTAAGDLHDPDLEEELSIAGKRTLGSAARAARPAGGHGVDLKRAGSPSQHVRAEILDGPLVAIQQTAPGVG